MDDSEPEVGDSSSISQDDFVETYAEVSDEWLFLLCLAFCGLAYALLFPLFVRK